MLLSVDIVEGFASAVLNSDLVHSRPIQLDLGVLSQHEGGLQRVPVLIFILLQF